MSDPVAALTLLIAVVGAAWRLSHRLTRQEAATKALESKLDDHGRQVTQCRRAVGAVYRRLRALDQTLRTTPRRAHKPQIENPPQSGPPPRPSREAG